MRTSLSSLASAFALAIAISCPSILAATTPPTADQILDRYIEASGGSAALKRLESRVMKGRIEATTIGATGAFVMQAKTPNLQASSIEFEGFGTVREGHDGKVAWSSMPGQGLRLKSGAELARVQRANVFPRELKLRDSYRDLVVQGPGKVDQRATWIVEGRLTDGTPDRFHFDQATGLLILEETEIALPDGTFKFQLELGDYREVDGVKAPFLLRLRQPVEMGFQIRLDEIRHNVPLPSSTFSPPKE
jgi:hypothetical protein